MPSRTIERDEFGGADPMEQQVQDLLERIQDAVQPVEPERGQQGVLVSEWTDIVREWLREVRAELFDGNCSDHSRQLLECEAENRRLRRREARMVKRLESCAAFDRRNKRLVAALAKVRSDALVATLSDERAAESRGARA